MSTDVYFKARLIDFDNSCSGYNIDKSDFCLHYQHLKVVKSLRSNNKIIISKPDKGVGELILNKQDYNNKMVEILNDTTKFKIVACVDEFDKTAIQEQRIQSELIGFYNEQLITKNIYEKIHPVGSLRWRLYRLPKIHKIPPLDTFYQWSAQLNATLLSG